MFNRQRIEQRQKIRAEIFETSTGWKSWEQTLLLISESLDDYIEYRIEADKTLVGILKDIQGHMANMDDNVAKY